MLGFGADDRVLIVNCDDFGMHVAINAAVVEAIDEGIASSCSLMVPCPGFADALRLLRERPHIPFGIHLTLIRDTPGMRWSPLASKATVPSLIDADTGTFYVNTPTQRASLLATANPIEVERELRAQIEAVVGRGLAPTHLDWHCLSDGGRSDISEVATGLAKEYGLALRVWTDERRRVTQARGKPVIDHPFMDSYSVGIRDKAARYLQMLRDLPPGLNEWAVHPAHGTEEWQRLEPTGWQVRQTDHEFLVSPAAREVLAQEAITVIDYRPLQEAWNA